jgi:hypothetical protein
VSRQLFVKKYDGRTLAFDFKSIDTVYTLKSKVKAKVGLPHAGYRMVYAGRQLEEDRTLVSCGIQLESTIHLVGRLRGGMHHESSGRSGFGVGPKPESGPAEMNECMPLVTEAAITAAVGNLASSFCGHLEAISASDVRKDDISDGHLQAAAADGHELGESVNNLRGLCCHSLIHAIKLLTGYNVRLKSNEAEAVSQLREAVARLREQFDAAFIAGIEQALARCRATVERAVSAISGELSQLDASSLSRQDRTLAASDAGGLLGGVGAVTAGVDSVALQRQENLPIARKSTWDSTLDDMSAWQAELSCLEQRVSEVVRESARRKNDGALDQLERDIEACSNTSFLDRCVDAAVDDLEDILMGLSSPLLPIADSCVSMPAIRCVYK